MSHIGDINDIGIRRVNLDRILVAATAFALQALEIVPGDAVVKPLVALR